MVSILVTGASGFVGRPACLILNKRGHSVRAFSRIPCEWPLGIQGFTAPALSSLRYTSSALQGVECVLHLAGRAHVMHETEFDVLSAFRAVNVCQTLEFARKASLAGVRRFVFVSSIKVNGEISSPLAPFTEKHNANPVDPYGISKYEAELGLLDIAHKTGMELVIIRPPLVYGPGVKGNFRAMMRLLAQRVPLPFGLINDNRRSFVALENLIDFLDLCISHPRVHSNIFLVSDQHDVSTFQLLQGLGNAMGLNAKLFPVPGFFLEKAAHIFNKDSIYQKLCGSLVVDSSAASRLLGWTPPFSLEEGLRRACIDFVE